MPEITLLDGGMGRELKRMGAPFRQPEWSALALMEAPDFVRRAHAAYIAAGAEVITTNSYAVVPFHIGEQRFRADGQALADIAGRMARQAVDEAGRGTLVAGSLPPLFGSYRADLFDPDRAPELLEVLVTGLAPHVDLWLGETLSSLAEAKAVADAVAGNGKPLWLSFTLDDDGVAQLRSGEAVSAAVEAALGFGAEAMLFNCSQPEVMGDAVNAASATIGRLGASARIGVYANAFPPQPKDAEANTAVSDLRDDVRPDRYAAFASDWVGRGATIVGGCCGIGPEHISLLSQHFSEH